MATSIGKLSKSFFVKLLVGIIILPFVFWGMGDVFRGGNQNVIATIDSKKVSTQEFMKHLNRLNLNEEQIKNLPSLKNNLSFLIISLKELSLTVMPDRSISKAITFRPMYSDKTFSTKSVFGKLFICSSFKFNRFK